MLSYIKLSAKRSKAVNHLVLSRKETRVLVSLAAEPKPAGDIAPDVLSTLFSHNLAVELMGHCRITPRGQLELHRQRFRKSPGRKVAKITPSSFLFLQEAAFVHNAPTRAKLREFVSRRRQQSRLPFFGAPWANRQPLPEDEFPDATDPQDDETLEAETSQSTDELEASVDTADELVSDDGAEDEASEARDIIGEIIAEFQIDDTAPDTPNVSDDDHDGEVILDLSESDVIDDAERTGDEVDVLSDIEEEEGTKETDDAISALVEMALKDEPASESDEPDQNTGDDILDLSLENLVQPSPKKTEPSRVDKNLENAYQLPLDLGLPTEEDTNGDEILDSETADEQLAQPDEANTDSEQISEDASGSVRECIDNDATPEAVESVQVGTEDDDAPIAMEEAEDSDGKRIEKTDESALESESSESEPPPTDLEDNKIVHWSRLVGRRRAREIPKTTASPLDDEKDAISD